MKLRYIHIYNQRDEFYIFFLDRFYVSTSFKPFLLFITAISVVMAGDLRIKNAITLVMFKVIVIFYSELLSISVLSVIYCDFNK